MPKIYAFISSLLGLPSSGQALSTGVQTITLPAHHLDRPGDAPKPKGFALVTFASEDEAARLVTDVDSYHGRGRDQGWGNREHAAHAPPDAPFPPGCLVYVRGVHPETNRTTLKALFAARGFGPDALDYVDYSKGMGTVRLCFPRYALWATAMQRC